MSDRRAGHSRDVIRISVAVTRSWLVHILNTVGSIPDGFYQTRAQKKGIHMGYLLKKEFWKLNCYVWCYCRKADQIQLILSDQHFYNISVNHSLIFTILFLMDTPYKYSSYEFLFNNNPSGIEPTVLKICHSTTTIEDICNFSLFGSCEWSSYNFSNFSKIYLLMEPELNELRRSMDNMSFGQWDIYTCSITTCRQGNPFSLWSQYSNKDSYFHYSSVCNIKWFSLLQTLWRSILQKFYRSWISAFVVMTSRSRYNADLTEVEHLYRKKHAVTSSFQT